MGNMRITANVARAIVDAGTAKGYKSTQTVKKPAPFEPTQATRDARVFEYVEYFEIEKTERRLKDSPGAPFYFGGPCDFFDQDFSNFEEAKKAFNSKPWTFRAFLTAWVRDDIRLIADASKPFERTNPYAATKLTSRKLSVKQEGGNWFHDGLPSTGLGAAPAPLDLITVNAASLGKTNFYQSTTPFSIRFATATGDAYCRRRTARLGDYVIVAVPPFERKENFTFYDAGGVAVIAMFAPLRTFRSWFTATQNDDDSFTFRRAGNSLFDVQGDNYGPFEFTRSGEGEKKYPYRDGARYLVELTADSETIIESDVDKTWWTLTPEINEDTQPYFPEKIERVDPYTGKLCDVYLSAYAKVPQVAGGYNFLNVKNRALRVTWINGRWEGEILGW